MLKSLRVRALRVFHDAVLAGELGGITPHFENFLRRQIIIGGRPFSFEKHGPLQQIVAEFEKSREVWVLKGAQIGLSTVALAWALYLTRVKNLNVGYGLPTKIFAQRFMKTRYKEVLSANPYLRQQVRTAQNVGLMTVTGEDGDTLSQLYMLGMENLTDAISLPLDALIFDEVDILNRDNLVWANDRLAASAYGSKVYFSVGMNPGTGIDEGYQQSDQRIWLCRCPGCGLDDQVLEELFPDNVHLHHGSWQLVCVRCGKPLDPQAAGRWVARHSDRQIVGYRVPQLIIPQISLSYIMDRWQSAQQRKSRLAKFKCSSLALPDAGERQRITNEQLQAVTADYSLPASAEWSVGGADVGDKCHVTFADVTGERLRFIHLSEIGADRMVKLVSQLITDYNCGCFVIDAKPFRTEARRLARLHPGVVVLQYFKDQSFGQGREEHEGVSYRTVNENRDDSLDAYCDLFDVARPGVMFPKILDDRDFRESVVADHHLVGSQKVEVLDNRTGRQVARYRKQAENHFLMACNNARKALRILEESDQSGSAGVVPVFGTVGD
ncbi:phage terminase large subunit family protein [Candidatus Neomarinimicrobiota bacterium]